MSEAYDGRVIANYVLDFCDAQNLTVSNLPLQKIVYFCHVWSLVQLRHPLIRHSFEAWELGPVLPYLYRDFKNFERAPITTRARAIDPRTGLAQTVTYDFDSETDLFLREVVGFYSRVRVSDLVRLSHAEGGPWHKAWFHGGNVNPGMKIADTSIAEFYSRVQCPFSIQ